MELCRLLLDEGADPCIENRSNVLVAHQDLPVAIN